MTTARVAKRQNTSSLSDQPASCSPPHSSLPRVTSIKGPLLLPSWCLLATTDRRGLDLTGETRPLSTSTASPLLLFRRAFVKMEPNSEEAIKFRDRADDKMTAKDFKKAYELAMQAQQLHAGLKKISQMLMICKVHCTNRKKLFGKETDLYGILQVQQSADEVTIKTQYKKLALEVHPDKNYLPGAEEAFKLIGEARELLLNKHKRSKYDGDLYKAREAYKESHECSSDGSRNKQHVPSSGEGRSECSNEENEILTFTRKMTKSDLKGTRLFRESIHTEQSTKEKA